MSSALRFLDPVQPEGVDANGDWEVVRTLVGDANGEGAWSRQKDYTGFTHDAEYLMQLFNNGAGGLHLNIPSAFAVDGAATTARNALVGESTADITGATTLNDTLHTVGAGTFDSTLDVTGAGTFGDTLDVTGAVDFDATLNVDGAATFNGAVTLGNAAGDTITVTGTATFTPLATFTTGIAQGAAPAAAGAVRLSNATTVAARNAANSADLSLLSTTNLNNLTVGSGTAIPVTTVAGTTDVKLQVASNFEVQGWTGGLILGRAAGSIGFYGAAGAVQGAVGAAATDPATTQTLANNIRTLLRNLGLSS